MEIKPCLGSAESPVVPVTTGAGIAVRSVAFTRVSDAWDSTLTCDGVKGVSARDRNRGVFVLPF